MAWTKAKYAAYERSVAEFIEREEITALSTGTWDINEGDQPDDYEGEPWFSWRPCQCCGSDLGGDREYLYGVDKNNDVLQFEICLDCVYYTNYGRLDDMSLMEIEKNA